jgi:hypothetical protein
MTQQPSNIGINYQFDALDNEGKKKMAYYYQRLVNSRDTRDSRHYEFDEMNVQEWVEFNAKTANSYIPPRKNATDVAIVTGTAREKMLAIVSNVFKMNLDPEVLAYDKHENEDATLGQAFTNLLKKSNHLEDDEDKKVQRMMYLCEQGTVFLEEAWVPTVKTIKKIKNKAALNPVDGFKGLKWIKKEQVTYKCEKNILDLTQVYLGNILEPEMEKQPYVFTRQVMDYEQASTIYGKWANWKYVRPGIRPMLDTGDDSIPYRDFRLYPLERKQVEVIKYQDAINDEYQIFINGVMMLPINFPLPWEWDGYSITKSVYEYISPFFAYGKSMMAKVRIDAEILDDMLRMLIHKTKQSIKPPMANLSMNVLSPRIYDPGTIWQGLDATKLMKIIDHQGVNSSEFNMYQMIQDNLNKKTVSETFQGQASGQRTTATEILEMQRQAQIALGLVLFAVQRMEEKASYLRLYNILENWTKPIDTKIDETKGRLVKKYKSITIEDVNVEGKMGSMKVNFIDKVPNVMEQERMRQEMMAEEKRSKTPYKRVDISLPLLRMLKYNFVIKVNPSERQSSNLAKVLFREELEQAFTFFPEDTNKDFFKNRFAQVWQENPEEMFTFSTMPAMEEILQQNTGPEGQVAQQAAGTRPPGPQQANARMTKAVGATPKQILES